MLYEKNASAGLSPELFRDPTSEYRGTPFWAWNCRLEEDELLRQISVLKEMGFGGFHMHCRAGMATEYLGDEFNSLVRACVDKAEKEKMLAWLYDEDRWPSGFAGGLVTKYPEYRQRYLIFTPSEYPTGPDGKVDSPTGTDCSLLAAFGIVLGADGRLESYETLDGADEAKGDVWYAYVESPKLSVRYNGYTYANLMDKKSVEKFIEVTHEAYRRNVGDRFGTVVPAIFTDEPQFVVKTVLPDPFSKKNVVLPWTDDLPLTYREKYGDDLVPHIPELVFETRDGISLARYRYHDHTCDRFADAFAGTLGEWCEKNGIKLTGHMMREPLLSSQNTQVGEAMRSLARFQLPGIDMLCDNYEFTTAKQAASAAHQYGREGVLSELYGVTGWEFDFRGHKLQGDWQAALGVSVRVPHLSWVSMEGEAKRDYPASINYQSSWYRKYPLVEDHFARVNTAMTRGRPGIRVGVIHPIESMWLHWGPSSQTAMARDRLDSAFVSVTDWLLRGLIDFDYISEALLPELCSEGGAPLRVGGMSYDAVVVPVCDTLRSTTVERLRAFARAGGRLIFASEPPALMDAVPSSDPAGLCAEAVRCDFSSSGLLEALSGVRDVDIVRPDGTRTTDLIHQLRRDGDCSWLFIAKAERPYNPDTPQPEDVTVRVRGCFRAEVWDTVSGDIREASAFCRDGCTCIPATIWSQDSLLLKLIPSCCASGQKPEPAAAARDTVKVTRSQLETREVGYSTDEPNVLTLDICEYAADAEPYAGPEEVLRIDTALRQRFGYGVLNGNAAQPWCIPEKPVQHCVRLRFAIDSRITVKAPLLALEAAEKTRIVLNGKEVPPVVTGWYTDRSIKTVRLPDLPAGRSVLELTAPFGERTATERCYILGDFGVEVRGSLAYITEKPGKVGFGSLVPQGFPFYGGSFTYRFKVTTTGGRLEIAVPNYRATCYEISVDGGDPVSGAFAPYATVFDGLAPGEHDVDLTVYLSRGNAFGPIHCANERANYPGPNTYRTSGNHWCYEYRLKPAGVMTSPTVSEYVKK